VATGSRYLFPAAADTPRAGLSLYRRGTDPLRAGLGSRANALARIWGLPPIFQEALRLRAHYVIEFMSPRLTACREKSKIA